MNLGVGMTGVTCKNKQQSNSFVCVKHNLTHAHKPTLKKSTFSYPFKPTNNWTEQNREVQNVQQTRPETLLQWEKNTEKEKDEDNIHEKEETS